MSSSNGVAKERVISNNCFSILVPWKFTGIVRRAYKLRVEKVRFRNISYTFGKYFVNSDQILSEMEEIDNTEKGALGEKFVNEIAYNSFLRYWCYPGPLDIAKDNKEICDLLVVFRSICIIVSVKNYSFKGNYDRYFRSTTERAIRQIHGAEKTLWRDRPVLLLHPDRPAEMFDKTVITTVYRVVINLNTAVKIYQTNFFDRDREFIVMDSEAWQSAMTQLDTLPDFINYLNERLLLANKGDAIILPRHEFDFGLNDAQFMANFMFEMPKSGNLTVISGTELDMIATYYNNEFSFPKVLIDPKFHARTLKLDGEWDKFVNSPSYQQKLELEAQSYFVDQMVKEMIIDKRNGDKLARMLFSLNRFQRTFLAGHFNDFHAQQQKSGLRHRPYYYLKFKPNLVFLYFSDNLDKNLLQKYVDLYLLHAGYLLDYSFKEIGLIGKSHSGSTFAFGYMNDQSGKPSRETIAQHEEMFNALNLKLRSDLASNELAPIIIPFGPLADSPF
jgi:hypothetical protein